ncbi:MAG: cysteine desulfurase family protein [Acidobacteria bacterium]|nr:cysteine desulfurase family protein [Acidobacteriota bacterium]
MDRFYFDHNATTPVSPEVLEAFSGALAEVYGNASSIHHYGQAAKKKLEQARREVAALLNADPGEIVFVSGGTEADNLAVLGAVRAAGKPPKHVVTTAIEHPAVLQACAQLEREGVEVTYAAPDANGVVDPDDVRRALRPETVLISVMHANNELGTLQQVAEIARIAREAGVLTHSDGVQAAGRIPVDVAALGVDLYSISGHKMYAPKGIGALYVRKGVKLAPLLYGGHHERDLRAGTENVPGAVALGRAAAWARENLATGLAALRDRLEQGILERVPDTAVNGAGAPRIPNTTNIRFDGIDGEAMAIALDLRGFAVSSGAACSSGAVEPSHVLTAVGLTKEQARSSLRFSLGRQNDQSQVDALIEAVAGAAAHLRRLSPAYHA